MPLMFTPGQFRQRSEFYHQLSQLTAAGIGVPNALSQLERHPPARSYRRPIREVVSQLNDGNTLTDALQYSGPWLPAFDTALLQAGEQSGRLDACFRLLADYYQDRARIARQLINDLAYPVFLFHFAVVVFTFVRLFSFGDWNRFLIAFAWQTLAVLLPLYAVAWLVIYSAQSRHGEKWRAWMEVALHWVPVLGTARQCLALARLAAALEALVSAGVTIVEAWELAAVASGSPALRRAVLAWRPRVDAGKTPAEVVSACARFPELFASQYSSGEVSGKLDETLGRLRAYYQEEGTRKLHSFAQWTPRGIYLLVMLMIAYLVVRFWVRYFQQIGAAGGF